MYADQPELKTRLVLDLDGLHREDVALLALSLRDVCQGKVTLGFGAGKGYGEARGEICSWAWTGEDADWEVPACDPAATINANVFEWLSKSLLFLPQHSVAPCADGRNDDLRRGSTDNRQGTIFTTLVACASRKGRHTCMARLWQKTATRCAGAEQSIAARNQGERPRGVASPRP